MSHTPGPWSAVSCRVGWYIASAPDGAIVVDTGDAEGRYGPIESEANARLIAAAPELLAALQAIAEGCSFPEDDVQRAIRDRARAAIAKATQP